MTFSIVARCPETGDLGVTVSTARIAVGNRVPFIRSGVGAIATQADTNVNLGYESLRLLAEGKSATFVLEAALKADSKRNRRQLSIIDQHGHRAAFTGEDTTDYKGHLIGLDCIVAGNMLVGAETLHAMINAFENANPKEPLAGRLLGALLSGQKAGGDKRGRVSAALIVVRAGSFHPIIDLRVDSHSEPVAELIRIYHEYRQVFG